MLQVSNIDIESQDNVRSTIKMGHWQSLIFQISNGAKVMSIPKTNFTLNGNTFTKTIKTIAILRQDKV
jgi:hypothetical protein